MSDSIEMKHAVAFRKRIEDLVGQQILNEKEIEGKTIKRTYRKTETLFTNGGLLISFTDNTYAFYHSDLGFANKYCEIYYGTAFNLGLIDEIEKKQWSNWEIEDYDNMKKENRRKEYLKLKKEFENEEI